MKIIRVKKLPFGVNAIYLFGILLVCKSVVITDDLINHERIHAKQYSEITFTSLALSIFFIAFASANVFTSILISILIYYILYCAEYAVRYLFLKDRDKAYRSISFEREAYQNDQDFDYIDERFPFSWLTYIKE